MADQSIVITVDINAHGAVTGVNNVNAAIRQIERQTQQTARASGSAFDQFFGSSFFNQASQAALNHFGLVGRLTQGFTRDVLSTTTNGIGKQREATQGFLGDLKSLERQYSKIATLEEQASRMRQALANRKSDFAAGLGATYGGNIDANFLRKFAAEKDYAERAELLLSKGLSTDFTSKIERASIGLNKLERDGSAALQRVDDKLIAARNGVAEFEDAINGAGGVVGGFGGVVSSGMLIPLAAVLVAILAIVAAFGLFSVGALALAKHAASVGDELADVSGKINFSAETLGALKIAGDQSGVSLERLSSGLSQFNRFLGNATEGGKKQIAVLDRLGVDYSDNETALAGVFKVLANMPEGFKQSTLAMQLFGKGGKDVLGIIKQTGGDLPAFIAQMKAAGVVMSNDGVRAANEFSDKMVEVNAKLSLITANIGVKLLPTLLNYINEFETKLTGAGSTVEDLGDRVNRIMLGVIDAFIGAIKVAEILAAAIYLLAAPFLATMVIVERLAEIILHVLSASVALAAGDVHGFVQELGFAVDSGSAMIENLKSIAHWASVAGEAARDAWAWITGAASANTNPLARDVRAAGGHTLTQNEIDAIMRGKNGSMDSRGIGDVDISGLGGGKGKTRKAQETELEKLTKQYKELSAQIKSLQDVGSREFDMRFKVEDLQKFKGDLDAILKLRHELDLPLKSPLPTDDRAARVQIEALERLKKVRDDVRRVQDEQRDADDRLTVLTLTATIPVVDASTRAAIKYLEAVRERKNAEQELTADIIKLSKLRADALNDEIGTTTRAYQSLRKDLLEQVEQLRGDAERERLLQRIASGGELDIMQKVSGRIEVKSVEPPRELVNIESYVKSIAEKLGTGGAGTAGGRTLPTGANISARDRQRISQLDPTFQPFVEGFFAYAQERGVNPSITSGLRSAADQHRQFASGRPTNFTGYGTSSSPHQVGRAVDFGFDDRRLGQSLLGDYFRQYADVGLDVPQQKIRGRYDKSHLQLLARFISNAQTFLTQQSGGGGVPAPTSTLPDPDIERVTHNEAGVRVDELRRDAAHEQASLERDRPRNERDFRAMVDASRAVLDAEESAADKQKQFDLDLAARRRTLARERRDDERNTAMSITLASEDLTKLLTRDAETVARVQQHAREKGLQDQIATNEKIIELQYEIAHASEGAPQRYELAWYEAIRNVQREDENAITRQIQAQVQLADASVYHADRANAKVLEFMASQKSITDTVADFKVGVMQTTFDLIDRGLDRVTSKLGIIGSLVKDFLSSLIRLALNKVFQSLFLGGGAGGAGGGGIFGGIGGAGGINVGGGAAGGAGTGLNIGQVLLGSFLNNRGSFMTGGYAGGAGAGAYTGAAGIQSSLSRLVSSSASSFFDTGLTSASGAALSSAASTALLHEAGHVGVGAASAGAFGGLGASLAPVLPFLGLTAGSSLGGQSLTGQLVGGAGGLLLGGAGAVGLLGGSGAAIFGTGGALSSLGGVAALLSNPFTIAAGAALLIGALVLSKNKARREAEKQRTALVGDAITKLQEILRSVGSPNGIDPVSAIAQAKAIVADYTTQAGQIKDSKTRRIALQEVEQRLNPLVQQIEAAANRRANAQTIDDRLIPTFWQGGRLDPRTMPHFDTGGLLDATNYGRLSIGGFDGRDRYIVALADDETTISPRDRAALGGSQRFREVGIRGYAGGGNNSPSYRPTTSNSSSASGAPSNIVVVLVTDDNYADNLVAQLSATGEGILAVKVSNQVDRDGTGGLAGRIVSQFE